MLQTKEIPANFDSAVVTARRVCHDESFGNRLGAGTDSCVTQVGSLVYKVYKRDTLNRSTKGKVYEKIFEYKKITNIAFRLSYSEQWIMEFPTLHTSFPLRVNPFPLIVRCTECQSVVGIVPAIEGDTLVWGGGLTDSAEVANVLDETTRWIGNRLGVRGILLSPVNIKQTGSPDNCTFIITDLAASIGLINYSDSWNPPSSELPFP